MHAGEGYFTLEFSVNKKPKKNRFEIPSALCAFFRACVGLCGFSNRIALCVFPLPSASAEKENTMSWNNAQERKKFEANWKKEEAEFRAAGMTEEQIRSIRELEEEQYRSDRRYYSHTQPFPAGDFGEDDEEDQDDKSTLYEKFLENIAVMPEYHSSSRFGWIEEITNEELTSKLKTLSQADLELLTMFAFDEMTQAEIAVKLGISQQAVSKKLARIKKVLK